MTLMRWSFLLVLGLSSVGAPSYAYAAEEKISPEARAYFRNGVELLQSEPPNYQDAYYQFKLAFDKSKSWKVLGNLGLCAVKLERDGEALAFYQEYVKRGGNQIDKEEREAIERDMLLIKGNGATLELTSKAGDLKIQDSRTGSPVTPQTHEMTGGKKSLFVRAGAHRLTVTATDGRTLTWEANVEPGRTVSHDFDFDAPVVAETAPAAPTDTSPVAPRGPEPRELQTSSGRGGGTLATVGFIAAGVGVAGLGGGLITGLMAKSKESSAKSRCNVDKVCDPSAEPLFDDATSLASASTVLWIGGGALTAVGVGLVVWGYSSSESSTYASSQQVTLVPVFTGGAGGLVASGSF